MEINKMTCKHCGRQFFSRHYTGGYIDHYTNFSAKKDVFGKDVYKDLKRICYHGNELRDYDDIYERLDCYLKWDNISTESKNLVKEKCDFLIAKMKAAEEKAESIIENMTMLERKYLIKQAQENYNTPYGNEDGKLWD